jgi:kynurenine formamidase
MGNGIVTRGVFLDVAASRGRDWLEPEDIVTAEDLREAERSAGARVGRGDALIVGTGLARREASVGPENPARRAGLATKCLQWFAEREIALYGGDCFEHIPTVDADVDWPVHRLGLAGLGLAMLDNVAVEPLAGACSAERRSVFLFVVAPLRAPNATGSAVNPLCIF